MTDETPQTPKYRVLRSLTAEEVAHAVMKWLSIYESDVTNIAGRLGHEVRVRVDEERGLLWEILVPQET